MIFSEQMYNFAFEIVKFEEKFVPFKVPDNIANLVADLKTNVFKEDGTVEESVTSIELVDCRLLYPELITESIMVGDSTSRMYCLDDEIARV